MKPKSLLEEIDDARARLNNARAAFVAGEVPAALQLVSIAMTELGEAMLLQMHKGREMVADAKTALDAIVAKHMKRVDS